MQHQAEKNRSGTSLKIVVIANPASSRGQGGRRRLAIQQALDAALAAARRQGIAATYEIVETTVPGQAIKTGLPPLGSGTDLARKAARAGADIVVAAGGDGTVREVVNGIIGTKAMLGILPLGTGNEFSRALGIGLNLDRAARTLVLGQAQLVDIGQSSSGYFVNIAGCGFDAAVAETINHGLKYLHGRVAYLAGVVKTLISFRPLPITLEIDGVVHQEIITLCAVANARSYGGGMQIAPNADLTDGLFDIVLVGNVSKLEFLAAFPQVFKGTHTNHPKVKVYRGAEVRITSKTPVPLMADGEEIGVTPVEFTIVPKAIQVMVPKAQG